MKLLDRSYQLIKWAILVPVAAVMVAFAIANREAVVVRLDPLPLELQPLPLYIIVFAAMLLGLLLGGFAAWWRGLRWRRQSLRERQRAERLDRELAAAQSQPEAAPAEPGVPRVA